ncbi:hypothetical protein DM02DRAFT_729682 [Periconia macrospinosa]|uniref:Zn(2)-C6 fungal-type domain-containing protein n=1 Tax=Periconia macrospinosa TaxID=97972 RepID=A0A2V1DNJ4_9PLEO|nr:hypothetical protein DM02DRAFT_729682 [Periconia macrospinosa]
MPCNRCRIRHYRCDGERPNCGRCVKGKKNCVYDRGRRFRRSSIQEMFSSEQPWISFPPGIRFHDESREIRSQYAEEEVARQAGDGISQDISPVRNTVQADGRNPPTPVNNSTEVLPVLSLLNSESPPRDESALTAHPPTPSHLQAPSPRNDLNDTNTFVYQQPPGVPVLWPLDHEQEAMLLQHYIEEVALFFDMMDTRCHFGVHVVHRAKNNSTLMNAILALSARQLSRTTDFDAYVADAYYSRCFETLIPALNDDVASRDESLLAATIILRLLEEINISVTGSDPQGHLFGTQAIIRAAEQFYAATSGPNFRQAIYWAAFRQELWISLMTQRAFQLHIFPADRSFDPADDPTWATRTIAHLGDVCHFAFGEERHSVVRYNQLVEENKSWRVRRPDSFDPFFCRQARDGSGSPFPDIRFHEKTHVMGHQYNTLAQLLLVVHDPTIPQLGPSHKQARRIVDKTVQDHVRTLCGVAMSNLKVFPGKFVACFAIALVGDRFTSRADQEYLRDLWYDCERSHGFPPTTMIHQLEQSWGWSETS